MTLPIEEVLEPLAQALSARGAAVLLAPPGAGKTTVVPGLLVDRGLSSDQVWVLEPRRLAARLAATRVAESRGGRLGHEVGYRVRFEDVSRKSTRILYVTEGILTRRLVQDPLLEGIGAVILDEFHERSIHADLGLAFLKEVRSLRPELKVVVMSATLSPGPVAAFLDDCPVIESRGRAHPIATHYLERPDERRADARVVAGVKRALRGEGDGDVLAFLPGARDIERAQRQLRTDLGDKVEVLGLHGEMEARAQDAAVRPRGPTDPRRVVLATNVAESSLTIPGVDTVVDAGQAKRARFDPGLGVDHLELTRISRFSADQRAGRAGRLGPGRAFRMWTEAEQRQLPLAEPPEVARVDLAPALLQIIGFGTPPERFEWFEAPPAGRQQTALHLLGRLGAIATSGDGARLTPVGEVLAGLPVHPRLGKLLLVARSLGVLEAGAQVAALASERDVLRHRGADRDAVGSSDLLSRWERLEAVARGADPDSMGLDRNGTKAVLRAAGRLAKAVARAPELEALRVVPAADEEEALLRATLAGFPDRVARRRDRGVLQLAEGGTAKVAEDSVVKDAELLVVVRMDGRGSGRHAVASWTSRVERAWLAVEGGGLTREERARFDESKERVEVVRVERFGALELSVKASSAAIDPSEALAEAARGRLDRALPITDALQAFLNRYAFVRRARTDIELPELGPKTRAELLPELALGARSFADLRSLDLVAAYQRRLPPSVRLAEWAPTHLVVPSGRKVKLRYPPEGPPVLSVRLQEVFGLHQSPRVAGGKVPVKMELLAPNQRPVQVTQDLESFWSHTYAEVRKELRRRYPKHQWPEDPSEGIPSMRANPKRRR